LAVVYLANPSRALRTSSSTLCIRVSSEKGEEDVTLQRDDRLAVPSKRKRPADRSAGLCYVVSTFCLSLDYNPLLPSLFANTVRSSAFTLLL